MYNLWSAVVTIESSAIQYLHKTCFESRPNGVINCVLYERWTAHTLAGSQDLPLNYPYSSESLFSTSHSGYHSADQTPKQLLQSDNTLCKDIKRNSVNYSLPDISLSWDGGYHHFLIASFFNLAYLLVEAKHIVLWHYVLIKTWKLLLLLCRQ